MRASALHRLTASAHGPHLLPGGESNEALLAAAEGGLYVAELSGTHTLNEVTGEISLGASGWAIKGGATAAPVEGVTVAGSLLEWLSAARPGKEPEIVSGVSVPALLIPEAQVVSGG